MDTNEKAHLTIWEMYCQKHGINPDSQTATTSVHGKVDRHKVDEHLYNDRIRDDDPLNGGD